MATISFGELNFGKAQLGDRRRQRRLVETADRLLQHPGGSWPDKLNQPAALKGLYRLVNHEAVTHASVLAPHLEQVRQRMVESPADVLILHDTTDLDYTGLSESIPELGILAGKGRHRGLLCHHSLAVAADSGEVLGLVSQILHSRARVPKNESRRVGREKPERESRLWRRGCEASPGPSPNQRVIDIADRGGDLFEFLDFEHAAGRLYVVRSLHNRECVVQSQAGEDRKTVRLHDYVRSLPAWGHYEVEIPVRDRRPARTVRVRIVAAPVWIAAPRKPRGQHGSTALESWVVYVGEEPSPEDVSPLEWVLLTNVPVPTLTEARQRVRWYERRWLVEELHKAQKTGCAIEEQQFTAYSRLTPVIALLSVVAVELLRMRNAARRPETRDHSALQYFPAIYVEAASAWRYGTVGPLTVAEFYLVVARMGGHQNRKRDHPPGWLVLWRGWTKLENLVCGAQILAKARSG